MFQRSTRKKLRPATSVREERVMALILAGELSVGDRLGRDMANV
jgi:hypothetical protein